VHARKKLFRFVHNVLDAEEFDPRAVAQYVEDDA
jgi:hypothetical protein